VLGGQGPDSSRKPPLRWSSCVHMVSSYVYARARAIRSMSHKMTQSFFAAHPPQLFRHSARTRPVPLLLLKAFQFLYGRSVGPCPRRKRGGGQPPIPLDENT